MRPGVTTLSPYDDFRERDNIERVKRGIPDWAWERAGALLPHPKVPPRRLDVAQALHNARLAGEASALSDIPPLES